MTHILVVEDEKSISDLLEIILTQAGYRCTVANDGLKAADLVEQNSYDLVLLDIMLPEINGYELLEYISPTGIPVIFLTAKSSTPEKVQGLKLGADDYLTKPFEPPELLARIETVLRRCGKGSAVLTAWDVVVDTAARSVQKGGKPVSLTPYEFDLLEILLRNRGTAFYRDVLFERVWGGELAEGNRTLDLHILRLRQKLGWHKNIKTIYKVGYMLERDS